MKNTLVIGSRGSKLALRQAELVQSQLKRNHPSFEIRIEIIKTTGDVKAEPLSVIGGKGVFTKELEDALLDGRIDAAVHSLKDLPTNIPGSLKIAAICKREDPRDALIFNSKARLSENGVDSIPRGAVVGTSSQRRLAQLKHIRPDLVFKDLRGNVDTRLRKLDEGDYQALILACAGLRRLGLDNRISMALPAATMLPAVGQGALGLESRVDDQQTNDLLATLDHKFTRLACLAERAFLRGLGGGCQLPIAAHAVLREKRIKLDGLVADPEGRRILRDRISGSFEEAESLGSELAKKLLAAGAGELLNQ